MVESSQGESSLDPEYRVIKRYTNRKLYDTRDSRYVTLLQVADMIREGADVRVLDNTTKEDKTEVTLALIISEELKTRPRALPLPTLEALVRHRGGKLLSQLREGPLGRLGWPATPPATATPAAEPGADAEPAPDSGVLHRGLLGTLEQWQVAVDERMRTLVPSGAAIAELEAKLDRLTERVTALELRQAAAPPAED